MWFGCISCEGFCRLGEEMEIIILLLGGSLLLALGFLVAFFWAVRSGQYDDSYTPSVRMLLDDDDKKNINL